MPTLTLPRAELREFFADSDGIFTIYRDKDSVLDYVIDWATYLAGDNIVTSAWAVTGVTQVSVGNTTLTTTIKVSGGSGEAKNTITTVTTRTYVRRLRFIERKT